MRVLTLEVIKELALVTIQERNIDAKHKLQEFYKYLNCDVIDIVEVEIDGHFYDIIADDEALLKSPKIPTVFVNEDLIIFGSCAFCRSDCNGNTIGITESDCNRIRKWLYGQDIKMRQWFSTIKK